MKHSKLLLVFLVTLLRRTNSWRSKPARDHWRQHGPPAGQESPHLGLGRSKERVNVVVGSQNASTVADDKGHWETMIGPLKAGGPLEMTISGTNTLTIKNILVGEVWVCSGQSNMEWPLINAKNGAETVAQANYPEIRLFTVQKATSDSALDDVKGRWVVTSPDNAGQFSAVGYFFGRELNQKLKVPVGLIHTSWGGTPAEAWTSHEMLSNDTRVETDSRIATRKA